MKKKIISITLALVCIFSMLLSSGCSKKKEAKKQESEQIIVSSSSSVPQTETDAISSLLETEQSNLEVTEPITEENKDLPALKTLDALILNLKNTEFAKATALIIPKIDSEVEEPTGVDQSTYEKFSKIFAKIEYKVIGLKNVTDSNTDIVLEISAPDFKTIFVKYMTTVRKNLSTQIYDDAEHERMLNGVFEQSLNDKEVKIRKTKLTINVKNDNGTWKIQDTKEFAFAMLGGCLSVNEAILAGAEQSY